MGVELRILVVADSVPDEAWLTHALREGGYTTTCVRVSDEAACRRALDQESWDMVVCCFRAARAPAGLGALQRRDTRVDAAQDALLAPLSDRERRELRRLLERVVHSD